MFWKRFLSISALILLIGLSACNLPRATGTVATNPPGSAPLNTQVAQMVTETMVAQTAQANNAASTQAVVPTDTPQGDFTVTYASVQTCPHNFGIKFQITNTGSIPWESNQVSATNHTSNVTKTAQYDNFPDYNSADCNLTSSVPNLAPEANGTTSVFGFGANPVSRTFTATIKVCSQDGLAGVCLSKTIDFTP